MNRAERRLLDKAKGDPQRAAQIAMTRGITGARTTQSESLIHAMNEEADADMFDQAFAEFRGEQS